MKNALIIFLFAISAGCGGKDSSEDLQNTRTYTTNDFLKVEVGMTKSEVRQLLGKPNKPNFLHKQVDKRKRHPTTATEIMAQSSSIRPAKIALFYGDAKDTWTYACSESMHYHFIFFDSKNNVMGVVY